MNQKKILKICCGFSLFMTTLMFTSNAATSYFTMTGLSTMNSYGGFGLPYSVSSNYSVSNGSVRLHVNSQKIKSANFTIFKDILYRPDVALTSRCMYVSNSRQSTNRVSISNGSKVKVTGSGTSSGGKFISNCTLEY